MRVLWPAGGLVLAWACLCLCLVSAQLPRPNDTYCPYTNRAAFHQPVSRAYSLDSYETCYTLPFTAELTDTWYNSQNKSITNITTTYTGTLIDATDILQCAQVMNTPGETLLYRWATGWGFNPSLLLRALADPQSYLDRPRLPAPISDLCVDRTNGCYTEKGMCDGGGLGCPVFCGTCGNKTWELRATTFTKVLRASVGTCCGVDASCRLSKMYVSEIQWVRSPTDPPPQPRPLRLPTLTSTGQAIISGLSCDVTAWEAFLPSMSNRIVRGAPNFQACVAVNATVQFEETLITLVDNRIVKARFNRTGIVNTGRSINNGTCADLPSGAQLVDAYFLREAIVQDVSLNYSQAMILAYGERADASIPVSQVCRDTDVICFAPGKKPCGLGSFRATCPATCNACDETKLFKLTDIKLVSTQGQVAQCCSNDTGCTSGLSVVRAVVDGDDSYVVLPDGASRASIPQPASSGSPSGSGGADVGKIVGILIGGVAGVLIIAVAAAVLLWPKLQERAGSSKYSSSSSRPTSAQRHMHGGSFRLTSSGESMRPTPESLNIAGLAPGELFARTTALEYSWAPPTQLAASYQCVEAGINDVQLDSLLPAPYKASGACPIMRLSRDELRKNVFLLQDGLLGKGSTALVFKALWPARFGPSAVVAVKLLKLGYEAAEADVESFQYEANVLSSTWHPNVVRMLGYCLEKPNVCLILEVLQHSLNDLLYKQPLDSPKMNGTESEKAVSIVSSAQADAISSESSNKAGAPPPVAPTLPISPFEQMYRTLSVWTPPRSSLPALASAGNGWRSSPNHDYRAVLSVQEMLRIGSEIAAGLQYLHDTTLTVSAVAALNGLASAGSVLSPPSLLPPSESDKLSKAGEVTPSGSPGAVQHRNARIVHRDLKPANILFNSVGRAIISDFGLARTHQSSTIVTERAGAGTLPYMAPELLMSAYGQFKQPITNKVDVYSTGCILYEMLSGDPPWKGNPDMAILAAVTNSMRPQFPGEEHTDSNSMPNGASSGLMASDGHSIFPPSVLAKLENIIKACWHQRESKRPTAASLHSQLLQLLAECSLPRPQLEAIMDEAN